MNIEIEPLKIWKIVLTGGPCGGKTSALAYLREVLHEMGYMVMIVPEAATFCKSHGISPSEHLSVSTFQEAVMDMGFKLEDIFYQSALYVKPGKYKGIVILCDRGIVDSIAYMSKDEFRKLLRQRGEGLVDVRDVRYNAVLHMTSAAIGAEENYTLENNPERTETLVEAKVLDRKTLDAWTDHPHVREIGNDTDFETKLKRLLQEVCVVLGEPVPIENERKFLARVDLNRLEFSARPTEIEQVYLLTPDDSHELRVRKRGQDGEYFYTLTEKRDSGPGKRLEIERIISERDYECFLRMRDPRKATVKKTRYCFFFKQQYLEIDRYSDFKLPKGCNTILEIELTTEGQRIYFPDWISYVHEVTDNPEFKNASIAIHIAEKNR
jgi:CYTH domain-containing protein/predicted ATPase